MSLAGAVSLTILFVLTDSSKFGVIAEHVTVYSHTVEEGKSTKFECDSQAKAPFYYYKYTMENINPIPDISKTLDKYPLLVYAINSSSYDCISNLRTIPGFLERAQHSLNVSNITVEFNNVLICCQGYQSEKYGDKWHGNCNNQNVSKLSAMSCHRVNVLFSPMKPKTYNPEKWVNPLIPKYNQRVVIACPLKGNPDASYQWYLKKGLNNDVVLIQPHSNLNITFLNNNRTLYFDKFKEEHNGNYICSAKNYLGNNTHYFPPMTVHKCSEFNTNPSVTINASHNLFAFVGDDLVIKCIVASLPNTANKGIGWFKNDSDFLMIYQTSPNDHIYHKLSNFDETHCRQTISLFIRNLTFEDSGNYICRSIVSGSPVDDTMLLTVTTPIKQTDYKSLIVKISVPVSIFIIMLGVSVTLGIFYYLRMRQVKLQNALEEYGKRPLPKKGNYQYDFFFAMTEADKDKLEVDKLYVELKQSFSIYYQLDQYLPGRTKVEMVSEGIKNSRFIIILLSKVYLQQKDEIARLELMYTMNRIRKEFTKCAFVIPLEDNLFIPYNLRHITKFPKEGASIKLKELACTSSSEANSFTFEDDSGSVDAMELESLNDNDALL